jgi:hypothetical protein
MTRARLPSIRIALWRRSVRTRRRIGLLLLLRLDLHETPASALLGLGLRKGAAQAVRHTHAAADVAILVGGQAARPARRHELGQALLDLCAAVALDLQDA